MWVVIFTTMASSTSRRQRRTGRQRHVDAKSNVKGDAKGTAKGKAKGNADGVDSAWGCATSRLLKGGPPSARRAPRQVRQPHLGRDVGIHQGSCLRQSITGIAAYPKDLTSAWQKSSRSPWWTHVDYKASGTPPWAAHHRGDRQIPQGGFCQKGGLGCKVATLIRMKALGKLPGRVFWMGAGGC